MSEWNWKAAASSFRQINAVGSETFPMHKASRGQLTPARVLSRLAPSPPFALYRPGFFVKKAKNVGNDPTAAAFMPRENAVGTIVPCISLSSAVSDDLISVLATGAY